MRIDFTLNGKAVSADEDAINITLLQWLRREGWTGSKEGCAEGDCGACSVVLRSPEGPWRAINSCLVPLALLAGREVKTVEGVGGSGQLHAVQQSMVHHHGSQCGYCTPGFICSLFEASRRPELMHQWQLDDQLAGNLCRCTGYRAIHDAACEALATARTHGDEPPAPLAGYSYTNFQRPASLAALLDLRAQDPEARLIAGATEMGLELTKKFRRFERLISVEAVPELQVLRQVEGGWEVGAAVTLTRIEAALAAEFPSLGKMLRLFGSRQIRSRATLGGNLVTASPIGDSAPVLLSLDARVKLASTRGARELSLGEFFLAYRRTALAPDEVMQSVFIPSAKGRQEFFKVSKRREMDISTVAGAFRVALDPKGGVEEIRLAYGGVAATPARAKKTEAELIGKPWTRETFEQIKPTLLAEFAPISDVRGSATYRSGLIASLLEKFFVEAPAPTHAEEPLHSIAPFPTPPAPHESGHKHVTGEARYVDDAPLERGELVVWPVTSPHAHARILRRNADTAKTMPGVHAVLMAEDVPGLNDVGPVRHDEILLADTEVFFHGHLVALVVGETEAQCRDAAAQVIVEYEPLPAILNVRAGVEAGSFHTDPNTLRRGDIASALASAPQRWTGEFEFAGQEHFYLEGQAARAIPGEAGAITIFASTQHPSEIQAVVSHVLHVPRNLISVECPRMGGGFGGKETQGNTPAALAALAAQKTGRTVRVRLNRDQDMMLTGKRHPFLARFEVGHDAEGRLLAVKSEIFSDGGWSLDLSMAITDRALFHHDNSYYIPAMEVTGRVVKTNLVSNTAFRGFGGPQGMLIIEEIVDRVARRCGLPPEVVRERNLYHGRGETNTTHYGQEIGDERIGLIWRELKASSEIERRRGEIAVWNAQSPHRKRGLAMTPVKFGISFTVTHLNQAGALVLIYQDGTVQVNHGGTEMGQGLHTKMQTIACRELGLTPPRVRVMATRTDKVPNTSATAASSGSDLNGAAVRNACITLRERLAGVAAEVLSAKPEDIVFASDYVSAGDKSVAFENLAFTAYMQRVSLAETGYYATPEIGWDRAAGKGRPFYYFACGAAVAEVEVDGFTGMLQVLRTDILHDCGSSLNEGIDRGQVEGGFVQGMGWLTGEELLWDNQGRLLTHSPDTYKIPAIGDVPKDFRVTLLPNAAQPGVVHGTKAVGEPPLMLAISVREAIRDAVGAFRTGGEVSLASPATCEAVWRAIHA